MHPHWILVVTQQGKERLAVQNISRQNYEYFLPMIREGVLRGGKKIEVAKPLFPRYLFVKIQQQWSSLTGTYGVSGVVMDGKNPRYVPERIVDQLKNRQDADGFVKLDEEEGLKAGSSVKVVGGLLEGKIGIFQGMSPDERAIVLFSLLGGDRPLKMDPKVLVTV